MKVIGNKEKGTDHPIIKGWPVKLLGTLVLGSMTTSIGHTTDLEIYQGATYGNATIMMMLDNSGSMDARSIKNDYPNINFEYSGNDKINQPIYDDEGNITDQSISYRVYYSYKNNKYYYDRMSRLKMALIPMLANPKSETAFGKDVNLSKYKIGFGQFFSDNPRYGGEIRIPALALSFENRIKMINHIKDVKARTSTPIANAYAEAGAYMLGTSTVYKTKSDIYKVVGESDSDIEDDGSYEHDLEKCTENDDDIENKYGIKYYECEDYEDEQDDASSLNLSLLGGYDLKLVTKKKSWYFESISGVRGVYNLVAELDIDIENDGTYKYDINRCTSNKTNKTETDYGVSYYKCKQTEKIEGTKNSISDIDNILNNYGYDLEIITEEEAYYLRGDAEEGIDESLPSGFNRSADDTKVQPKKDRYDSPIESEDQCSGYGIYFLTDGSPNQSDEDETLKLMNNSLKDSTITMGNSCDSGLLKGGSTSGWKCIGEYSTKLLDKNNIKGVSIATATVGFGRYFEEIQSQPKISKVISRNGKTETVEVYDCSNSNINSANAKNLCTLGEKGYGYGEGGFYYAETSEEVADSVKTFIADVSQTEINPISAGTMSVPLDSLGGLRSRGLAYLPILEPVPGSQLLWNGNLKKYKVKNTTLVGSNDEFVFADSTGLFAKNTFDLWNTINDTSRTDTLKPDQGLPQVGGTYQKVFENAAPSVLGNRNLFVDNGNSLTNLKVSNDKKPINFDGLSTYNNDQKRTLLGFMGYSAPADITITDGEALSASQDKWLKNIGGVLHSIPQLITQKVEVEASGQFNEDSRKDYLIYGSMDGALHMVDDSTGKETFTFVPKQILELQPAALTGKGSAIDGSYPYGVDAPWLTYVSYTTKATATGEGEDATTVNTYEADQSFALGGLRMGGSMYYALDVSNVDAPSMIYSVGSNYANRLKGDSAALIGTKNGTSSTSAADQTAFAKMGQSWGKPTLGYVKSGGKRVMVSFLPGGYDTCYENPAFKLNTSYASDANCNNKSSAQGNAVYMVQMGEVKTKTNNEETVDTTVNNGKLLWWANNQGSSSDRTSRSSSLQYSKAPDLKHSVVTQIRALDRNYDGLIDHIYFADLGGQVWRADINNNADTDNFKVDRVVKVLDVSDQVGTGDAPPRIYERPLVTFSNGSYNYKNEDNESGVYTGVQAMITVGTGDRSSPVTAERAKPDALYTVIDKDITRNDLFYYGTDTTPAISLRTPIIKVAGTSNKNDKLQELKFSNDDLGTTGIKNRMQANVIQGWYMPFTHWLGNDAKVSDKYKIKMFNEPDALSGVLISSSFNPDVGQEIKACSAGVRGETQRERTCLPYGVCLDGSGDESLTARSFFNAGSGIVDNIVSQYNATSIFTSLKNRCEGDDCKPEQICPSGDCDNEIFDDCVGATCGVQSGVNTDKRINPLSWIEH